MALPTPIPSYHAGEMRLGIRAADLPVRTLDMGGAHGLSAACIGASDAYFAESYRVVEVDPAEVAERVQVLAAKRRRFMAGEGSHLDAAEQAEAAWTTVFVEPAGDWLPHRYMDGKRWPATRGPLSFAHSYRGPPIPWQMADLIVDASERVTSPRIHSASRLVFAGRLSSADDIPLPTGRVANLSKEDLFILLAEERAALERSPTPQPRMKALLKGVVNPLASGLPIQVNSEAREPAKEPDEIRHQVSFDPRTGGAELLADAETIEGPGPWYFSPLASAIQAETACSCMT